MFVLVKEEMHEGLQQALSFQRTGISFNEHAEMVTKNFCKREFGEEVMETLRENN